MTTTPYLELLAPAKTADIGREAILHGADAVYIGGPSFGARAHADNDIDAIAGLVEFAHRYRARIFVTLNTILHDAELEPARKLVWQLYDAGVDALIVQDMGLLELDLPPIQLHASTQCDIRTVEKAKFLADAGFSQLVLARELTLEQIRAVHAATDATLEFFIHGALCVAFSGQCYISHAHTGRSANRGECSQACRLPYTLTDTQGRVVAYDKHLLSMKDNNQSANLRALIDAGIRSFKIEGRYKDADYVKNVTAHYRLLLDDMLDERPELARASSGRVTLLFTPDPDKTFHRSATDYFVNGRQADIGAFDSPKYVGVAVGDVVRVAKDHFDVSTDATLHNGDGLNYMHKRDVAGVQANRVERIADGVWRVWPNERIDALQGLKVGVTISRNRDHAWEQALTKKSAERRIDVWMHLSATDDGLALDLADEDGVRARVVLVCEKVPALQAARAAQALREGLSKLGNTIFVAREITIDEAAERCFVPAATINALRRDGVTALEEARRASFERLPRRAPVEPPAKYPEEALTYLANVYNDAARRFYARHGVGLIDAAFETNQEAGEVSLMITKHCLRYSFNLCPKQAKGVKGVQGQVRAEPMTLMNGAERLTLRFDCRSCEMHVIGRMKKHILASPPPVSVPVGFYRKANAERS